VRFLVIATVTASTASPVSHQRASELHGYSIIARRERERERERERPPSDAGDK